MDTDQTHYWQDQYYQQKVKYYISQRRTLFVKRLFFVSLIFLAGWFVFAAAQEKAPPKNILPVVKIAGEIGLLTDIHQLTVNLEKAFKTDSPAVVLSIDSPGGDPNTAERVIARLLFLKQKNPEKKVIAVCEKLCASAAYLIAIHADEIYAGKYSLVGSIGAIITTMNFSGLMQKLGIEYKTYSSGPYKDMLNPFLPSSEEKDEKAFDLVNKIADEFVAEVYRLRKIPKDKKVATGEIWTAQEALSLGLIDHIGVIENIAFDRFDGRIPVVIETKTGFAGIGKTFFDGILPSFLSSLIGEH